MDGRSVSFAPGPAPGAMEPHARRRVKRCASAISGSALSQSALSELAPWEPSSAADEEAALAWLCAEPGAGDCGDSLVAPPAQPHRLPKRRASAPALGSTLPAALQPRVVHVDGPACQCTHCLCKKTEDLCRRLLAQRHVAPLTSAAAAAAAAQQQALPPHMPKKRHSIDMPPERCSPDQASPALQPHALPAAQELAQQQEPPQLTQRQLMQRQKLLKLQQLLQTQRKHLIAEASMQPAGAGAPGSMPAPIACQMAPCSSGQLQESFAMLTCAPSPTAALDQAGLGLPAAGFSSSAGPAPPPPFAGAGAAAALAAPAGFIPAPGTAMEEEELDWVMHSMLLNAGFRPAIDSEAQLQLQLQLQQQQAQQQQQQQQAQLPQRGCLPSYVPQQPHAWLPELQPGLQPGGLGVAVSTSSCSSTTTSYSARSEGGTPAGLLIPAGLAPQSTSAEFRRQYEAAAAAASTTTMPPDAQPPQQLPPPGSAFLGASGGSATACVPPAASAGAPALAVSLSADAGSLLVDATPTSACQPSPGLGFGSLPAADVLGTATSHDGSLLELLLSD